MSKANDAQRLRSIAPELQSAAASQQYQGKGFLNAINALATWSSSYYNPPAKEAKIPKEMADIVVETQSLTHLVSIATEEMNSQLEMDFVDNSSLENDSLKLIVKIFQIFRAFTRSSVELSLQISKSPTFLSSMTKVLKGLKAEHLKQSLLKDVDAFLLNLITACYHLALHDEVEIIDSIRDAGILPQVEPYLKSPDPEIRAVAMLLLIYLVREDEADKCADETALKYLLESLKEALSNGSKRASGLSVVEILRALSKLAAFKAGNRKLGNLGVLDIIKTLIQSEDNEHAEIALSILWQLAFEEENANRIKEANMDSLIQPLTRKSNPLGLEREASGILWTLDETTGEGHQTKENQNTPQGGRQSTTSSSGSPDGSHIMISYQWDNQPMVIRLKSYLEDRGYQLWVDIEDMGPALYASMAQAVENSWLVLVCFSKKYKERQNTRLEAEYAAQRSKPIIPLKMDDFIPDGWLGLLIAGKLYYDFSESVQFDQKASELVAAIEKIKSEGV